MSKQWVANGLSGWRMVGVGLFLLALGIPAAAATALDELYRANAHPLQLKSGRFSGGGAQWLEDAIEDTQFVALGETHNNRDIREFTSALFELLHARQAYQYFATEQDPLMMQRVGQAPARGRAEAVRTLAQSYPYGFTFISDQELAMLARIGAISEAERDPIWGAEQAFGATHYLHELRTLAFDQRSRDAVEQLLASALEAESAPRQLADRHFMSRVRGKEAALSELAAAFEQQAGAEATSLIRALQRSDEIYGYYHRASAGELVGLWNNWVREDWMKERFIAHYRQAEARDRALPKVLLKYGGWHIQRGRAPGNVFSLGGFVHELATYNGKRALSLQVIAYRDLAQLDGWPVKEAFGDQLPASGWQILDLRPYRPWLHAGKLRRSLSVEGHEALMRLAFGFDALVLLAASPPATFEVTGADY